MPPAKTAAKGTSGGTRHPKEKPTSKKPLEPKKPIESNVPVDAKATLEAKQNLNKEGKSVLKQLKVNQTNQLEGSFIGQRLRNKARKTDDDDSSVPPIMPRTNLPKATGALPKKKINSSSKASALGDDKVTVTKSSGKIEKSNEIPLTAKSSKSALTDNPSPDKKKESKTNVTASTDPGAYDQEKKVKKPRIIKPKIVVEPAGINTTEVQEPNAKAENVNPTKVVKSRSRKKPNAAAAAEAEASESDVSKPEEKQKKRNGKKEGNYDVTTGEANGDEQFKVRSVAASSHPNVNLERTKKNEDYEVSDLNTTFTVTDVQPTNKEKSVLPVTKPRTKLPGLAKAPQLPSTLPSPPQNVKQPVTSKANPEKLKSDNLTMKKQKTSKKDKETSKIQEDSAAAFQEPKQGLMAAVIDEKHLLDESVPLFAAETSTDVSLDGITPGSTPNTTKMKKVEKKGGLFRGQHGEYLIKTKDYRLSIFETTMPRFGAGTSETNVESSEPQ